MNPYVKSVQPLDDYLLALTFENGEHRIFDLKPYLGMGVFARLRNIALLRLPAQWPARSNGAAR